MSFEQDKPIVSLKDEQDMTDPLPSDNMAIFKQGFLIPEPEMTPLSAAAAQ